MIAMNKTTEKFKCDSCDRIFETQEQLQGHQANQYTDCKPKKSENQLEEKFDKAMDRFERKLMKVEKDQMEKNHDIQILVETLIRVREYLRGHGDSKYTHKNATQLIDEVLETHGQEKVSSIGTD